jgi:hypothetical protein
VRASATRRDGGALPLRGVPVFTRLCEAGLDPGVDLGGAEVVRRALVARVVDASPLAASAGAFQLVHPGERRSGRRVRQLQSLAVTAIR